jgi:DNA-nicking Smr family endonuclease
MAKRTKAEKKPAAKAPKAEPFYRPFSKIKPKKAEKPPEEAEKKPAAKHAPKPAAKHAAKKAPKPEAEGEAAPVDAETFAIYMAGVRALPDRAHRIPRSQNRIERAAAGAMPKEDPDADARARMRSLVMEGVRFETVDDGEHLEGRRLDVDPRDLRRLRRGQFAVDGKLDLHGLGREEARGAVEEFVKKRATDGDRVVVVVHGKGSHSPRQTGVLRGEIAAWLSQGKAARHVAAFATAPVDEGGPGAVLVLLAR